MHITEDQQLCKTFYMNDDTSTYISQILMSAKGGHTIVMRMPPAPTHQGATHVCATMDFVEMVTHAQVSENLLL